VNVPLSWLREYVDVDVSPRELASLLTFSGTEVAAVRTVGGDYTGIVVGEIVAIEPHPNADRLTVCRVNNGSATLQVVCGATNFRVGDKAPLAQAGCVLPNGMKIKKAKVRGVESLGMLCAEDEMGLSDRHEGLLLLPRDTPAGIPFGEIAGPPDTVLELEVTPNRPDCLSMIGIAREVAALLGKPLRLPSVNLQEGVRAVESIASVAVQDADGCPRYTARVIGGVAAKESPGWMQRRLTAAGVRPINVLVDITNYVMLECGQPLHAFDYDLLTEGRIVVRRARAGETLNTLDGNARELRAEMLVIADAVRPVAVAGVMGGAGSEIRDVTRTVLLESACFKPSDIRQTSKRLGLSTESSYRFERGVDEENVEWASRRAAALMAELAGGEVARGVIDCYPAATARRTVELLLRNARQLLGIEIPADRVAGIFRALGFSIAGQTGEGMIVEIPAFRVDIDQEADLIEEIARIHGLDKIPTPPPAARLVPDADDRETRAALVCRNTLVGLGLTETLNYSFLSERLLNLVGLTDAAQRLVLPNPISAEHTVMRDSLIPQMIETLGKNLARQARQACLFEMGRVFRRLGEGEFAEEERLCVGLLGPAGREGMRQNADVTETEMFQWIKGVLEAVCQACHTPRMAAGGMSFLDIALEPLENPCLAEGRGVSVRIGGESWGVMGLLSDRLRDEWRMTGPVAVLEVAMRPLVRHVLDVPAGKPLCSYPVVDRDVAMMVPDAVTHEAVLHAIRAHAPPELCDVRLFDVYRGESLGKGRKSMAYSLTYRSMERTLRDEEVNGMHDAVKAMLRRDLGAEIREN